MNQVIAQTQKPALRDRLTQAEWRRMGAMFGFIAFLHIAGGLLMWKATSGRYELSDGSLFGWGTAALAYVLGMRHAFDADHISAIDNTTRKLMSEGQRPLAVGFFFSLGHSSVVMALALLLNFGIKALGGQLKDEDSALHHYTGLIGLTVSGTFLMIIAILNLVILVSIIGVFIEMRKGTYSDEELEKHLNSRGLLMRFFGPIARRIDKSWKMYPLGILFGLGFDTATEIGLLVLAGSSVVAGLPWWAIISLPLFFAGGMSLLDTIDGSFMNFAYGWAFSKPVRKVYYNIIITGLSVAVALFVGGLEICQVIAGQLNLTGGFWDYALAFNLNSAGYFIVGAFVVVWAVALLIWRYGKIEERWHNKAHAAQLARGENTDHAAAGMELGPIRNAFTID
ncbi:high-affinity nickel-transport protein [Candidatus Planktophila limnetica]|jgi:high-affinity nickel-transport protein|uniref:Nickel/cobalt efflux system n=1 Tax=Candidatus Planktophila limnetica TaxID=573600 RepID=A0A249LHA9_9ACTN|nr:HoxN/HupN/NixA family nickel/cobalt transporter [Candidatus Planktophila limnetica]ASY28265.1 high-affinity nickel-transport protein [Candidatus Planktophila limnetica]